MQFIRDLLLFIVIQIGSYIGWENDNVIIKKSIYRLKMSFLLQ